MRRRFFSSKTDSNFIINNYLTLVSLESNFTVKLGSSCEYCIDGDGKWIDLPEGEYTDPISTGQTLSFKSINNALHGSFTIEKQCNVKGNIMSIVYGDFGSSISTLHQYEFVKLFYNCSIVDASELQLPSLQLTKGCYDMMFEQCSFLTKAPILRAPVLTVECYYRMFNKCTSLNEITMLATDISAENCIYMWTSNVSKSGTFIKHPDADLPIASSSTSGIPSGWNIVDYPI